MKLVIVGGVAGGAAGATRARRVDEKAEIIMFERGEHVSFSNCGLPYYIGKEIEERDELFVTSKQKFKSRFNIDVRTMQEVIAIDRTQKRVQVMDHAGGETYFETYDKLILSPGARPIRPPLPGVEQENIFTLRDVRDTDRIVNYMEGNSVESAVVVGGGFIGLEMAENLVRRGAKVTVIEMLEQVMPPLDFEMAAIIQQHLRDKGVDLRCGDAVESFQESRGRTLVTTRSGARVEADMVLLAAGVKPESDIARAAGLSIGRLGGIQVDETMRTSDPDVFAVGDAVEVKEFVTGESMLAPLAGPAAKQARIAADNALGKSETFTRVQGTAVVRIFDKVAASTGSSEKSLEKAGRPYLASFTHSYHHASYYPGAESMSIKLLYDPDSGLLLGAQAVGGHGVDKRIDVLATAMRAGMTVFDLRELELAYAPQFGSAKDPVNIAGYVASNILRGDVEVVHWHELAGLDQDSYQVLDVRSQDEAGRQGEIPGSMRIYIDELRDRLSQLDRQKTYVTYCTVSYRAYLAYRILVQDGFKAKLLSGGIETYLHPSKERGTRKEDAACPESAAAD